MDAPWIITFPLLTCPLFLGNPNVKLSETQYSS